MKWRLLIFFSCFIVCISTSQNDTLSGNLKASKDFIDNFILKRYAAAYAMIDTSKNKLFTPAVLEAAYQSIREESGKFLRIDSTWGVKTPSHIFTFNLLRYERSTYLFKLSFTKSCLTGIYVSSYETKCKYKNPPYAQLHREVAYVVKSDSLQLPATLTLPVNSTRVPLVVFVHGSGPSDRDGTINCNKPFKDLALGLAAFGIASLRYEKRTHEYADECSSNLNNLTIEDETINDAVQAACSIEEDTIKFTKIFLLAHSFGGMCAPKIASLCDRIDGVILLAANARRLDTMLVEQLKYLSQVDSTNPQNKYLLNTVLYQQRILNSDTFSLRTNRFFLPMSLPPKYWFSIMNYPLRQITSSLDIPVLVLQGDRDYQVSVSDFNIWKTLCKNAKSKFILYPRLNHLFMEGTGKSSPKEYGSQSNISEYVIEDISSFIFAQ